MVTAEWGEICLDETTVRQTKDDFLISAKGNFVLALDLLFYSVCLFYNHLVLEIFCTMYGRP